MSFLSLEPFISLFSLLKISILNVYGTFPWYSFDKETHLLIQNDFMY